MSKKELAIASIPIQEWGETYDDKEALQIGTIFKDLNKPFFAAGTLEPLEEDKTSDILSGKKSTEQEEREELMKKISETGFVLDDLTLYLDTHEQDTQAKEIFCSKLNEHSMLKMQFAEKYYPLTRCHVSDCSSLQDDSFCWQKGPMPWEGACV